MNEQDKNQKLQFLVSEFHFNIFEKLRKNKFSNTTKQHLLEQIFLEWINKLTQNGRYI